MWETVLKVLQTDATSARERPGRWRSTRRCGLISTPPVPVTPHPRTSPPSGWLWLSCPRRGRRRGRGLESNEKNLLGPRARSDLEALGRSRGGLTSKIHLPADSRAAGSRVTSAGQRGDSLGFKRSCDGCGSVAADPACPDPSGRVLARTRPTQARPTAPTCVHRYACTRNPRVIPDALTNPQPGPGAAPPGAAHRRSTRASTPTATSSSEPSTS